MTAQRLMRNELLDLDASMERMTFRAFHESVKTLRERMTESQRSITKASAFVLDVDNWVLMYKLIEEYNSNYGKI